MDSSLRSERGETSASLAQTAGTPAVQGANGILNPAARWTLLAVALVSMAIAAYAAKHRTPWSDEGWFSSASYNLAKHGFFGTTVIESATTHLTRIETRTYWVMPLFLLGQAAWYKVFPADLFWTRMFSILWIPIALLAYYLFILRLSGMANLACAAAALLALSFVFIDNAAFARPDLMCCALGISGLAAYLGWRERSLKMAMLLSNSLIAASLFTHPNGIFHFAGLATLVMLYDFRRLNVAAVATAAAPYLAALALWGMYISADPQAFSEQMRANGTNDRWTSTLNPLRIFWNEIRYRYLVSFGLITRGAAILKSIALVAYLAAICGVLSVRALRNRRDVRTLLILLAVYFGAMSVFNQKLSYYLIHITPLYIALVAVFAHWIWTQRPRLRPLVGAALGVLVLVESGGILLKAVQRSYIPAERAALEFLRQQTRPADMIVGTGALLYGLDFDPRLKDDMYLGLRSGRTPDAIIVEPLYRDNYTGWMTQRPSDMKQILQRLSRYRLSYDRDGYQIYLRPRE
jgi:hypothetical protein